MRREVRGRTKRGLVVGLLVVALGVAIAQERPAPFAEDPLAISAAFGVEMAVVRLVAAAELIAAGIEGDDVEDALDALEVEGMRYAWALARTDAALAAELDEALEATGQADDPADPIDVALPLAQRARDALVADRASDPAFAAAMGVLLLTSATGVAEGFEGGVEGEAGAYAMGWAALQRVKAYWSTLEPDANDEQRFEVDDQLAELEALFPRPVPPDGLERFDPEEAEGPAYRIAGYVEDVSGALVFPDRDLARLYAATRDVARDGCAAYGAGDRLRGDAHLAWTAFSFDEYLTDTLSLFAPETMAVVSEALLALVPREVEEEGPDADRDDATGDDAMAAERPGPNEVSDACAALLEALDEAGAALGV